MALGGKVTNYSTFLIGTNIRSRQSNTAFQWQATLYVALLGTAPTDNSLTSAAESPYTGYTNGTSRQGIASSTSGWNAPSGSQAVSMTNASALNGYPTATGSGTIVSVGLCADNTTAIATQVTFGATGAVTPGTVYFVNVTSQAVASGNTVSIAASQLSLAEN